MVKTTLSKGLGKAWLPRLQTVITEIEAVLNDRHLTSSSPDIQDLEPLSPSLLLHGRPLITLPHPDAD